MPRLKKPRSLMDLLVLAKTIGGSKTSGNKKLAIAGRDQEEGLKSLDDGRKRGGSSPF